MALTNTALKRRIGPPAHGRSGHLGEFGPAHLARPSTSAAPVRSFRLSNDPAIADKVQDAVGLYVDPPAHAVVLSSDEKRQIQASDRTQPSLPLYRPPKAAT
jgi:hypothetical protein